MRVLTHSVGGSEVTIRYPETRDDVAQFHDFIARSRVVAVDTETSGLDTFATTHTLRLVQFGDEREAWVLRADQFRDDIIAGLRQPAFLVLHNAPYDLLVIDKHLGVTVEELVSRVFDTRIFAHLLDPRAAHEGGIGQALKDLSVHYIDPDANDGEKALTAVFRTEYKTTKAKGWAVIDIDHPEYIRYAGLDVILTSRLFNILRVMVKERGFNPLSQFEHHLQGLTALMERRGLLVDVRYTKQLSTDLTADAEHFANIAARYGVENLNSTKQVSTALVVMGESLIETTNSGALKVDKSVLLPMADLGADWSRLNLREPNPLADAVLRSKRSAKWRESYADAFLAQRDADDRIHPHINSLQARTARMSVSNPPLQQLPSGDYRVRRALVADPGNVMLSVDFSQVEMRVLAALADEQAMKEAFLLGVDLHDYTAEKMFGPDYTKGHRKLAKNAGFGTVYGGGAATLAKQTGVPLEVATEARNAYLNTYPGIKRLSRRLSQNIEYGAAEVITPTGRRLPVDPDRSYSAVNYLIQATARDLLAQAVVDLHKAGLGDYCSLPIHDEVLGQAPANDANDIAQAIKQVMEGEFGGVAITADAEIGKRSWGSLYGADY